MDKKPTYSDLECRVKKLQNEVLEYTRMERKSKRLRKLADYGHMKRTISLMKINEELNREIKEIKSADKKAYGQKQKSENAGLKLKRPSDKRYKS